MFSYCSECNHKLETVGLASEIYWMICEYFMSEDDIVIFFEPYFSEALRYLEINGYVITTECYDSYDLVFAKPRFSTLDDDKIICCSGNCKCSLIDFKPDST